MIKGRASISVTGILNRLNRSNTGKKLKEKHNAIQIQGRIKYERRKHSGKV